MKIPFHKPYLTSKEIDNVVNVLKSEWLTMGPKTIEFENKFQTYIGSKYAISVNSATAALHLSLSAIGVGVEDEVIVPTNTFIATAEAVAYLGANPVLCDIESDTHNINYKLIEQNITDKTKAIIPVHYGGHPCDMNNISMIAKKYNLKIIEDAAHALPALYENKIVGTMSDATCFSFYATKTMTTGEGGMVTTNNEKIMKKIFLQRLHGINGDAWSRHSSEMDWYYEVVDLGYKYNTTDIQSALGIIQLEKLDWMWKERKKIATKYINAFSGIIKFIKDDNLNKPSWHLFVIKVNNRDELYLKLKEKGIKTSVHFIPIHKQPFYKNKFHYDHDNYPVANDIFNKSLSLPIYPGLKTDEVDYIIDNILKYAQ